MPTRLCTHRSALIAHPLRLPLLDPRVVADIMPAFLDNWTPPGAIGFDRMASVEVACTGRSLGLFKKVSTTLTANNSDVAGRVGFGAPAFAMAA